MNKKKIMALTLAVLLLLPSTAFAKGKDNSEGKGNPVKQEMQNKKSEDKTNSQNATAPTNAQQNKGKGEEHKQEAQEKKDTKKDQITQFKTDMKAKHEQMKQLRSQTIALRKQVNQKKEQLSSIIADLESGKKTLSEDLLNSLLALSQNLLTDTEKAKETAEINTEVSNTEQKVKGADFNNALASMDKVIAKMQARLDALNKLNADLDAALKIANMAVAPAPTTGTGSTDTSTTTTGTSTTDTTASTGSSTTTTTTTSGQ